MDENPYQPPTEQDDTKPVVPPRSMWAYEGWLFLLVIVAAVLYIIFRINSSK